MSLSWGELFERAESFETTHTEIVSVLSSDRETERTARAESGDVTDPSSSDTTERVVADADVLAADLLTGESARDALDHVRGHSWIELVASPALLADASAVIEELAEKQLAVEWRLRVEEECTLVDHPPGDHPALASAYRASAPHLLSFDEGLTAAGTNLSLQSHMTVSIRKPDAFALLFDPEPVYEHRFDECYPGPDRDPRL